MLNAQGVVKDISKTVVQHALEKGSLALKRVYGKYKVACILVCGIITASWTIVFLADRAEYGFFYALYAMIRRFTHGFLMNILSIGFDPTPALIIGLLIELCSAYFLVRKFCHYISSKQWFKNITAKLLARRRPRARPPTEISVTELEVGPVTGISNRYKAMERNTPSGTVISHLTHIKTKGAGPSTSSKPNPKITPSKPKKVWPTDKEASVETRWGEIMDDNEVASPPESDDNFSAASYQNSLHSEASGKYFRSV
jgi:hypothetical protein